jgi:hypothetical protein
MRGTSASGGSELRGSHQIIERVYDGEFDNVKTEAKHTNALRLR